MNKEKNPAQMLQDKKRKIKKKKKGKEIFQTLKKGDN